MCKSIYIYIYVYMYTHTCMYIYIYREREKYYNAIQCNTTIYCMLYYIIYHDILYYTTAGETLDLLYWNDRVIPTSD